ncbi:MAG: RNA polymerase sigma factor, partial [Actinomycetota bacterium]|nr:RNA polymerase sigma factor [Actinomycetota bacterium]
GQDRSLWDGAAIRDGLALVRQALAHPPAGRYALMAAIAAVHAEAQCFADTDWHQLVGLYDLLLRRWPSPVVALNRAVAVSYHDGPLAALVVVQALSDDPSLATYPYLAATRADLLRRLNRPVEAIAAYQEARLLTENSTEAGFLAGRIRELENDPGPADR